MLRVGGTSSQLPVEMMHMISQYIGGNEHCLSLALSGRIQGFASFYGKEREKYGIFLGPGCYYLTPNSWDAFFTRYINPDSISKFSANHCYWLPGQWLCDNILKLKNLQDVSIKDTQISLQQLATVLKTCIQITKLDFSYTHEMGTLKALLEPPLSVPHVIEALKRLTHLKVATAVLDAKDYVNDPWVFIVKMLSYCQRCIDLTVDITYDGEFSEYDEETELTVYEVDVERHFYVEILPRLTWMKSLKSLVLLKHGSFYNWGEDSVRSRLFDHLFEWMFGDDPHLPNSLARLWVLCFNFPPTLVGPTIAPSLKAYLVDETDEEPQNYDNFRDVEHIGFLRFGSLNHLPNLKSAYGFFEEHSDPQEMLDFIRTHPYLEHLTVYYDYSTLPEDLEEVPFYVPNPEIQLIKLKSLCFISNVINKEMVEEFVNVYPNLKHVHLESRLPVNESNDEKVGVDEEGLSVIRFQNLTSLSLSGFHLDGSSLKTIITNCPKLEKLHLNENSIEPSSDFFLNLDVFLGSAEKLRDIRLNFDYRHTNIVDVLFVFNSLLSCASHLERLFIHWAAFPDVSLDHSLTDSIIDFAHKMERLVALCLVFGRPNDYDDASGCNHYCSTCCSCDDDHGDDLDDDDFDDYNDGYNDYDVDIDDYNDDIDHYHDDVDDHGDGVYDGDEFDDANFALMEQINQRMTEEVLSTRPALWFHLDSKFPDATDAPLVHYLELVDINPWNPPLEF